MIYSVHNISLLTGNRLADMLVDVSYNFSTNLTDRSTVCYSMPSGDTFAPDETRYLPCRTNATFRGQFVRITRLGASTTLILCEVQVHGVPGTMTLRTFVSVSLIISIIFNGSRHIGKFSDLL